MPVIPKKVTSIISSLMIALNFVSTQAIQGMEDFSKPGKQDAQRPSVFIVSNDHEMLENPFSECSEEIRFDILKRAAIDNYLSNGNTGSLGLVCKDWRNIVVDEKFIESIKQKFNEQIYQRFLNGRLIYKPNEGNDIGKVELRIANLINPLEGTFDLSQCDDMGEYLSISTGYRKGKKAENALKLEIWFAPRFLIEKEFNKTAKDFQKTFGPWQWNDNAPVGIFWTWGGWNYDLGCHDLLTTENMDNLSKMNLYQNYWIRGWKRAGLPPHANPALRASHCFMFIL